MVAHDSLADLRRTLPALQDELTAADELIVVDSGSKDGLSAELPAVAPVARLVRAGGNVGFAGGANLGAAAATGDLLVLLNPDARVQPGWREAIGAPWDGPWAGWMGLVTMDGGAAINTSGGVIHFTGLGWAGQAGEPISAAPAAATEVGFLSGACLAIPLTTWRAVGGFPAHFFMYSEDVDLSLRLRLAGGCLGLVPQAVAIHDYDFDKGPGKWRWLERNRWAMLVRTYPASLLVLVAPALLAAEAAIWLLALRDGWAAMKAQATAGVLRALPGLIRERRAIQAARTVGVSEFARGFTWELSSPYLGGLARNRLVGTALRIYWRCVLAALRTGPGAPATDTTRPGPGGWPS